MIHPDMPPEEKVIIYDANIRPLWADEALRDKADEFTADGIYQLTLLSTGNEDLADERRAERIENDMRRQAEIEVNNG